MDATLIARSLLRKKVDDAPGRRRAALELLKAYEYLARDEDLRRAVAWLHEDYVELVEDSELLKTLVEESFGQDEVREQGLRNVSRGAI
jgi:hypothetical protein